MHLGVSDADWMSLRNGLHLAVVEVDSCSFTVSVISLVLRLCVYSLVLSVRVCAFLHPDTFWIQWGLHLAATKRLKCKTCTRYDSREFPGVGG